MQLRLMIFFFFSSRRRHTRFDCDWSSDVCSSDLYTDSATTPPAFCMSATLSYTRRQALWSLTRWCTKAVTIGTDRKSTRLNSSHSQISYAVFCLKKKKKHRHEVSSTPQRFPISAP